MSMNNTTRVTVRTGSNGKVGAHSLVVALVRSGCDLESNFHYRNMTEARRAAVRAELGL